MQRGFCLHGQVADIHSDIQAVCVAIDCQNYGHSCIFILNFYI